MTSATGAGAIEQAVIYGNIVCVGSVGTFFEASWSKIHQARGNMRRPMAAQVAGARQMLCLTVLIFGSGRFPKWGSPARLRDGYRPGGVGSRHISGCVFPRAGSENDAALHKKDICIRIFFNRNGNAFHSVYFYPEHDSGDVFGLGCHRARALLQVTEFLFHSADRASDVYSAGDKL